MELELINKPSSEYKDFVTYNGPGGFPGAYAVRLFFPNGYGASIVGGAGAYGGLELAVLYGKEEDFALTYDTPVTDDVLGWLTPTELDRHLKEIKALPALVPELAGTTTLEVEQ